MTPKCARQALDEWLDQHAGRIRRQNDHVLPLRLQSIKRLVVAQMPRNVTVHQNRSAGSVHAEPWRFRSAGPYGCKGGPRRQAWRLGDAFFLQETGQQSELLVREPTILERVLTHDSMTPMLTLHPNYG